MAGMNDPLLHFSFGILFFVIVAKAVIRPNIKPEHKCAKPEANPFARLKIYFPLDNILDK